jgi:hypothetical protein
MVGQVRGYGARWQYINDWTCLGGYSGVVGDNATGWDEADMYLYPAVDTSHGNVLNYGGKSPGRVTTGDCNNANTLDWKGNAAGYGNCDNCYSYGFAWVYAPSGAGPKFLIGADDDQKTWVNGTLISSGTNCCARDAFETGGVGLPSGWSRVLFKVRNGGGGFNGTISLRNGGTRNQNEPSVNVFDMGGYSSYGIGYEQDWWYPCIDVDSFYGSSNPQPNGNFYGNDTTVVAAGVAAGNGPVPLWKVMQFQWGNGLSGDTNYADVTSSGTSWSHTQTGVTGHRRFHFFAVSKSRRTSFQSSGVSGGWTWDDAGHGNYMDVYIDNVAPQNPGFTSVTALGTNQIGASWALPLDQGVNIEAGATEAADEAGSTSSNYYRRGDVGVYVRRDGTAITSWTGAGSATDSGLSPNTPYTYSIEARDNTGAGRGSWHNTTGPQGSTTRYTLIETPSGLAFTNVTETSLDVELAGSLTNVGVGSSGTWLANTTKSVNTGWRANDNTWTNSGLTANTQYSFSGKARNGDAIETTAVTGSVCTLSVAPTAGSVTPSTSTPCVNDNVEWTAVGGFGAGAVAKYQYVFDQNATHTFTGSEADWSSGTLTVTPSAEGTWYLHVQGYNATGVANGTYDYAITATALTSTATVGGSQSICVNGTTGPLGGNTPAVGVGTWTVAGDGAGTFNPDASTPDATFTHTSGTGPITLRWTVAGTCGSSYADVLVTLNSAPGGIQSPASVTVCAGQEASFTASASGTPEPAVQWQVSADSGTNWSDITGATAATYSFTTAASDNGKQYRAVFGNTCASNVASSAATLTVNTPPSVTAPVPVTACVGATDVSFSTTAGGTETVTLKWQKNFNGTWTDLTDGDGVAGSGTATLAFNPLAAGHAGEYRVKATNACDGTGVVSAAAPLAVNSAPTIGQQPADATKALGQSVTFSVSATGTPAPTYQWYEGGASIDGATNASYTIDAVAASDAGSYTCVATNDCGSETSSAATLTVDSYAPTVAIDSPSAGRICTGGTVSFGVHYADPDGGAPVTVTLDQAGVSIDSSTVGGTVTVADGATSADRVVTISGVTGTGTFTITIAAGTAYDQANQLNAAATSTIVTVESAPTIDTQPQAAIICASQTASFFVAATGVGTLQYQWRKGGENITGATSSTYTMSSVTAGDAGSYDCVVTDGCGSTTSNAVSLTVQMPPSITGQPAGLAVCSGQEGTFTVVAEGTGPLSYQWQRDEDGTWADIDDAELQSYTTSTAGNYRCIVSGACSPSAVSDAATLTINTAPTIYTQPLSQSFCAGGSVVLTVAASGSGTLGYAWQRDAGEGNWENITGATSTNYSATAAGSYRCVVTNACGSTNSEAATVTELGLPVCSITLTAGSVPSCSGIEITLDAGAGHASYLWSPGGQTTQTITVSPTATTVYSVTVTNAEGCSGTSADYTQTVNAIPAAPTASNDGPACEGSTLHLTAGTVAGATYAWTGPNGFTSSEQNPSIAGVTAATAGTYSVTATVNGCTSAAGTTTVVVNVAPLATNGTSEAVSTTQIKWGWTRPAGSGYRYDGYDAAVGGSWKWSTYPSLDVAAFTEGAPPNALTANTRYQRWMATVIQASHCQSVGRLELPARYTLAQVGIGSDKNVTCDKSVSTAYLIGGTFTFSNPAGFGTGGTWKASSFEYKWDTSATTSWDTAGTTWSTGTLAQTPTATGDYYLHVRAVNGDGVPNNTNVVDYGPFTVSYVTLSGTVNFGTYSTSTSLAFTRTVKFVVKDAAGNTLATFQPSLSFTNNGTTQTASASYSLSGLPAEARSVSAKTAWHLRKKAGFTPSGVSATADLVLLGGDLNGSNSINIEDYVKLKTQWNSTNAAADINGDGAVGTVDYSIMKSNWFAKGDAE